MAYKAIHNGDCICLKDESCKIYYPCEIGFEPKHIKSLKSNGMDIEEYSYRSIKILKFDETFYVSKNSVSESSRSNSDNSNGLWKILGALAFVGVLIGAGTTAGGKIDIPASVMHSTGQSFLTGNPSAQINFKF